MRAAGPVAAELRGVAGGFPAGLVLHSWAGAAEVTRQLAAVRGVHFSLSGHTLRLAPHRLAPMLSQARTPEAAPPGLAVRPGAQKDARSSVAEALPPGCRPAELAQSPRPPALQTTASRAPWAGPSVCRTSTSSRRVHAVYNPNPITLTLSPQVPLDRLLLETDSPDGRPRPAGEPAAALRAVPASATAGGGAVGGAGPGERKSLAQRTRCGPAPAQQRRSLGPLHVLLQSSCYPAHAHGLKGLSTGACAPRQ